MVIGVLTIRLGIEYAQSLKDKRQVVKSLKERVKNRFNVAVAEVGDLEIWNRATLGIVSVSNDKTVVENTLNHVVNHVEADGRATVEDFNIVCEPWGDEWVGDAEPLDDDFGFLGENTNA